MRVHLASVGLVVLLTTACSTHPSSAPKHDDVAQAAATAQPSSTFAAPTDPRNSPGSRPTPKRARPTSTTAVPESGAQGGAYATPSRGGILLTPSGLGTLKGTVIAVDPGHNGVLSPFLNQLVPAGGGRTKICNTTGTESNDGYPEHAFTWDVAQRLVKLLRAQGASVVLTRPHDAGVGPCVNERAAIPNRYRANLLLSIHADGNTNGSARGFHVIRSTAMQGGAAVEERSARLATVLRDTVARRTGLPRSTYLGEGTAITPRDDIAGLNLLETTPGVMLEAGNMRHPADIAYLRSERGRETLAQALADAARNVVGW